MFTSRTISVPPPLFFWGGVWSWVVGSWRGLWTSLIELTPFFHYRSRESRGRSLSFRPVIAQTPETRRLGHKIKKMMFPDGATIIDRSPKINLRNLRRGRVDYHFLPRLSIKRGNVVIVFDSRCQKRSSTPHTL